MSDFSIIDIEQKAKECKINPYFMMDILSGDCLGVFTVENDEVAIRSFCISLDPLPESLVHDTVLIKYDTRELIFEGKDYIETWKTHQKPVLPMPHFEKKGEK